MTRRRDLLVWGGALGLGIGASTWLRHRPQPLTFAPIAGLPGFRRLDTGSSGAAPNILTGIDPQPRAPNPALSRVAADPRPALFGSPNGQLPIAVFSDYFCPYCAIHSRELRKLTDSRSDIRLILHEWPILTPRSPDLARLALAAKQQDAHWQAHEWLMQNRLPPGPAGVGRLARALDLDPDRLGRDAVSDWVTNALFESDALARLFGFSGTPGTCVGQTVIVGTVDRKTLETIIDFELETIST